MPNYFIIPCDGNEAKSSYIASSEDALTIGGIYLVNSDDTNIGCFILGEETDNPPSYRTIIIDKYDDCIDCITENSLYLKFQNCNDGIIYSFTAEVYFSSITDVPVSETIYLMDTTELKDVCLRFLYTDIENEKTPLNEPQINGQYLTCLDCLPPLSAGTIVEICQVCTDNSGTTTSTFIDAPHPTWTNGNGRSVVQLNMVALGGMNGLNS